MKCSLGISNFLEEISSLSHSVVFLYFFALIIEEGFLISPCYCLEWVYLSFSPLPFASLLFTAICNASLDNHFAFLHFFFLMIVLITASCAAAKSHQSCPTLHNPIDGSPPGSHAWDCPGKNTGVDCHFLLQCMKVKSESEVAQSFLTLHDPMRPHRWQPTRLLRPWEVYWSGVPLPSPTASCIMSQTSIYSSSGTLSDLIL